MRADESGGVFEERTNDNSPDGRVTMEEEPNCRPSRLAIRFASCGCEVPNQAERIRSRLGGREGNNRRKETHPRRSLVIVN